MSPAGLLRDLRREARGGAGRLAFFVASLAIGVAAVVAVAGLGEALERGIRGQARQLIAADLVVAGLRPMPAEAGAVLDRRPGVEHVEVREMLTLAAVPPATVAGDSPRSLLVELKGAGPGYPFYGRVELEPPGELATVLDEGAVVVDPELLRRLGLEAGDRLRLGGEDFRIAAVLRGEPDRIAGAFRLGPRVLMSAAGLERADLVTQSSRVRHRTLVRLPPGRDDELEDLARELEEALPGDGRYRVETYREAQPALRRGLRRMERYLGLAALLTLLVGGVGVAQTVRAWIASRLDAVAVRKCLGTRPREVMGLYLAQVLGLALAGSVVGAAAGLGLELVAARALADVLPVAELDLWQPAAILRGLALGMGVALVFALPPLDAARRTPPVRVLRRGVEPLPARRPVRIAAAAVLAAATGALAAWQARSLVEGALFVAGLVVLTALLAAAARLLMRLAGRPRARARPWLRYGLAALDRPGAGTTGAVVALGLGTLVVLGILLVERGLGRELDRELPKGAPSAFLIDVQPEQWPRIEELLRRSGATRIASVPRVVARLRAVDGRAVEELAAELEADEEGDRWALEREQQLTYLDELPADNRIVEGRLWSDPEAAELSVEREFAELLGLELGSVLDFDVQGVPVALTVTSVREVEWESFGINFYLVVEPGVLDRAPQNRVAAARFPPGSEQRLQDALADAFPNVTVIRIREVLEKLAELLRRLALAARLLGLLTAAAGLAILAGATAAGAARRGREVALLKTLGMTRRQVAAAFAAEYALVGLVAGLLGAVAATALAYAVLVRGLEITYRPELWPAAAAVLAVAALAVAAGLAASVRALAERPIEALRHAER